MPGTTATEIALILQQTWPGLAVEVDDTMVTWWDGPSLDEMITWFDQCGAACRVTAFAASFDLIGEAVELWRELTVHTVCVHLWQVSRDHGGVPTAGPGKFGTHEVIQRFIRQHTVPADGLRSRTRADEIAVTLIQDRLRTRPTLQLAVDAVEAISELGGPDTLSRVAATLATPSDPIPAEPIPVEQYSSVGPDRGSEQHPKPPRQSRRRTR